MPREALPSRFQSQLAAAVGCLILAVCTARAFAPPFSSGHFMRVLAVGWLGIDATANARQFMLTTGSLSALGYADSISQPAIRLWNETRHASE